MGWKGMLTLYSGWVQSVGYILLCGALGSLFVVSSQDPGIVAEPAQRDIGKLRPDGAGDADGAICTKCRLWKPREDNVVHCPYCEVCIYGYDHHCPWMGKCIGGRTAFAFYSFLLCIFSLLVFIIACVIAKPIAAPPKHGP